MTNKYDFCRAGLIIIAGGTAPQLKEAGLRDLTVGSLPKAEIWLKAEDPAVTVNANMLTRLQRGGRHCLQVPNAKNHPSFNFQQF